ncbi:hypothetical protein IFM89_034744 [Coptis chinensis]|uniref:Translin n=1 Tax=Coptis chinensis TaxID=261450 RepID=A0A835LPG3_9MAGN|nr:hypothetical protein IFM89_034744 [Coptis chinensis]
MKSASLFRNTFLSLSHSLNPILKPLISLHSFQNYRKPHHFTTMSSSSPRPFVEKQFEKLRTQLEQSRNLRDRIQSVTNEIESTLRVMQSGLLLVHQSRPIPEVLEKGKVQIDVLKELYGRLAEILKDCPGQYYRYHGDWRSETQTGVSLIAFLHWIETGDLLTHTEAEEKLGCMFSFSFAIELHLIGS